MTLSDYLPLTKMQPSDIVLTVIFILLVVVGVVGNVLVFFIIVYHRDMRNSMNYLLLNLAVADLITLLFVSPQYVFKHSFVHPRGTVGDLLCKFITGGNVSWIGGVVSVLALVSIAFERYYAVMYPYKQGNISVKILKITVASCWLFSIFFNLPLFFVINYNPDQDYCMETWPQLVYARIYSTAWFIIVGAMPVAIMVILYSRIIYWLWLRKDDSAGRLAVIRVRKKVTKMVIIVSVIYVICWFPQLTIYLLSYVSTTSTFGSIGYVISVAMVTVNSAVNPIVYSFQNERFRKHVKELVLRRTRRVMHCGLDCKSTIKNGNEERKTDHRSANREDKI